MKLRLTAATTACVLGMAGAVARAENNSVKYGIETMTKRFVIAYKSRDVRAIRRVLTPDFAWKQTDGKSLNADQAMEGLQRQLDRVVSMDVMTIKMLNITTLGDSASAIAYCTFRGSVRNTGGAVQKVTSTTKYKYYWIRTKKGWRVDGITDLNSWADSGKSSH